MTQHTLTIDLEKNQANVAENDCVGRILIVEDEDFTPGETITITVYGVTADMIADLTLQRGCGVTLGMGSFTTLTSTQAELDESVDFGGESKKQLTYPITTINTITARTPIVRISEDGTISCLAPEGAVFNSDSILNKIGHSCIGIQDDSYGIYGTVRVNYLQALYKKSWTYTLPNRTATHWFFLMDSDGSTVLDMTSVSVEAVGDEDEVAGATEKDITLLILDYVSEAPLEEVTVKLDDGTEYAKEGTTDEEGKVTFEGVLVGTHQVKLEKDDYVGSENDDLDNDEFIVE